jgi:GTP diphosphokinase
MQLKGIPFEEVYDLFAVRIIFDNQDGYPEKNRCWDIYTAITEVYRNRPDRLRDWISTPKGNGYQALHLTVLGPDAQWIEVQVRSRRMDEIAEKGLAAHWRYKNNDVEEDHELEVWLDTIREVLNHPDSKGMEFLNTVHLSLYAHDITAFTPKGRPITLPINASVLDFAYAVHTDLGDTCIGAKVNHKVVPISHRLSNGDQVEVLTSKMTQPAAEWLDFVSTAYAKVKIETALRRRQREAIARGEERLTEELQRYGEQLSASLLNRLTFLYHFDKPDTFLRYIGEGTFTFPEDFERTLKSKGGNPSRSNRITRTISSLFGGKERESEVHPATAASTPIDRSHPYELSEHDGRLNYIIAPCCHPIPGDDALGILTDEGQAIVHRRSCPEATRYKTAQGDRLLSTLWGHHYTPRFETTLMIRGIDSKGLLNAITQVLLEDFKVSISEIHMVTHEGIFEGRITVQVLSGHQVESICHILRRNKAIHEAYRLSELDQG